MTNKPMLSVEREHRLKIHRKPFLDLESGAKTCEIRDCSDRDFQVGDSVLLMLIDETGNPTQNELRRKITHIHTGYGLQDHLCVLSYEPAAQHQGEPVAQSEFEPDAICLESDGCPTEGAVLKRFWRENQPDPVLCEFYEAEDFPSLVRELVGHVDQLQEAAKRNVKPWEDTFPPTLLPAYIARINAEQPAPVAVVMPEHTMRSVMDAIQQARGFPMLTSNQCHALAESLNYVARLNRVKT